MNRLNQTFLLITLLLFSLSGQATEIFDDSRVQHIEYPDWFSQNPFFDLTEELATAQQENKLGIMVLFTTEGCSYCEQFIDRSLGNAQLAGRVQQQFISVGLEIFNDTEMTDPQGNTMPIKAFAEQEKAGFSPTLVFFNTKGERLLRLVGYQSPQRFSVILDYLQGKHYENRSLAEYYSGLEQTAVSPTSYPELRKDPLFSKPPYALDRSRFPASQPLLVIFEQAGCSECEGFHNSVLASQDIRQSLKQFDIVRLDATDQKTPVLTPTGNRVSPADWYQQTGISHLPAMLFFDEQGNEVLRTEALVLQQRMMNSLNYVLEQAYEKGWSYQRFARTKALERLQQNTNE